MKALKVSYYMISVLLIVWFLLSWMDIGFHNCVPNPVYHPMNFFMIVKGLMA